MNFRVKYLKSQDVKNFNSMNEISDHDDVIGIDCSHSCLSIFEKDTPKLTNVDIEDIENFRNLEYFNCSYNNILNLEKLPQSIKILICNSNYGITLSNLPLNLQEMSCMNCDLSSLPKLPSENVLLNCNFNNITN